MLAGREWLIDATGCRPAALGDQAILRRVCEQIIAELGLQVVGEPAWHVFPGPGGITGMFLLSESHLTCHTFPEFGLATLNLYCCRPRPEWPWRERLPQLLGAEHVSIRSVPRGELTAAPELIASSTEAVARDQTVCGGVHL